MVKIIDKLIDNMQATFDSVGIHRMVRFVHNRILPVSLIAYIFSDEQNTSQFHLKPKTPTIKSKVWRQSCFA